MAGPDFAKDLKSLQKSERLPDMASVPSQYLKYLDRSGVGMDIEQLQLSCVLTEIATDFKSAAES